MMNAAASTRRPAWLALLAVVAGLLVGGQGATLPAFATDLPAPFDEWDVEISPDPENPQILSLDFDSPLLGLRTRNLVWLPDSYFATDDPHAVMYYLHGTASTTHGATSTGVIDVQPAPENPTVRPNTGGFDGTLDRQRFVIVAPDAAKPWCITCNWVDGLDGQGVLAESHIHEEVIPLTEALFRVRTDRGGRGIIGHSMGGGGALIQGFRRPDQFAFVGSSSGTMTVNDDFVSWWGGRWLVWNRHQGFGPPQTHEARLRNVNLLDLTPHVAGSDLEIVAAIGDGCLDPAQMDAGECKDVDRTDYMQGSMEAYQRNLNNDFVVQRLIQAGVPITYVPREGFHSIGSSNFRRYFLDRANEVFERPPPSPPATFTYKAVDRRFSIWGYDLEVERPNHEFLHLNGARTDGTSVTLGGTGQVTLTTPSAFEPGVDHEILITPAGQPASAQTVTADDEGRITVDVQLGGERTIDERKALVESGRFAFPQTRIDVIRPAAPRG